MADLLDLFGDEDAKATAFEGDTYHRIEDYDRLANNLQRVFHLLLSGDWHSGQELRKIGGSEGVRRARDLRGDAWGPLGITAERVEDGNWRYRLDLKTVSQRIYLKIMDKNPDPVSGSSDDEELDLKRRRDHIIRAVKSAPSDVCERLERVLNLHGMEETQVGDQFWEDYFEK